MSARPKVPGEDAESGWALVRDGLIALLGLAAFGALLAIPHPITVLIAGLIAGS
jgi:hypothetical protein